MKNWGILLVVWGSAFVLVEAIGVAVSYRLSMTTSEALAVSVGQAATVIIRVSILVYFAPAAGISLSNTYRTPLPSRIPLLVLTIMMVGILAYVVNLATSTTPHIIQYDNFIVKGALWTIPFTAGYYLSEIVLLNYLYLLAKKSWSVLGSQTLAANLFLITGWASLHAITQNVVTAIFALVLVPIFYLAYEYTGGAPLTPILLWFVTLLL